MTSKRAPGTRAWISIVVLLAIAVGAGPWASIARAADPIKIGLGMALTGGLAANGKPALMAMQMWAEDVNKKGGLLGRQVQLIYYDDQTKPATVPAIYSKLLDVDKVDIVMSGYGTNMIAPAMPIVIDRKLLFLGLFGLANNEKFQYPNYFQILPAGQNPAVEVSLPFWELAVKQTPKPQTVAIVGADAEYPHNALAGAREVIKKYGLKIVYDATYPPNTTDLTSVARAIKALDPDIVFVASYPPDSALMVQAAHEVGLKPKLFGGGMVGLQFTALLTKLGPKMNGIVNYDYWVPEPTLKFPGIEDFLKRYQARAEKEGVDPLGHYLPPWAYAYCQVLEHAINGTKSLDQQKLADYIRKNEHDTIVGKVKFGKNGEWETSRVLMVQYQGIETSDLEQFKKPGKRPIVAPDKYRSGTLIYPYSKVK
ncbi:MAG: branched-chain amino acid ABC transporter substrate-binding protein [Candidatus Rokuibacteriota bacterium]|nr:MAG: branched-chain amino acid ABC transporter substrate-binding protein [Candidatus Rokubacteria bacterium]